MGQDKSRLPFAGKPLLQHVIDRTRTLQLTTLLVTNTPHDHAAFGLPMVGDVIPQQGSLGGIYTALILSQTPYVLCVACDMPCLDPALLAEVIALRSDCDIAAPYLDDKYEPFHAVYARSCLPVIERLLADGVRRIQTLFTQVRVRRFVPRDATQHAALVRSLRNFNTPEDVLGGC